MKILFFIIVGQVLSQSCRNGVGSDVDWWFMLKMPRLVKNHDETEKTNGYEYLYCDSINNCTEMEYIKKSQRIQNPITHSTSPLMQTVDQISFTSPTTMTVIWNDQQFDQLGVSIKAHSKGILSASNTQGFIINHSMPKFPLIDTINQKITLNMHTNVKYFGQHFFCVTMDTKEINKVAELYWNAQIIVQKAHVIPAFQRQHPNIFKLQVTNRRPNIHTETNDYVKVFSKGGLQLEVIAKPQRLKKDFYQYVLAEKLQTGFIMETWGLGVGRLQNPMCPVIPTTFNFMVLSNEERLEQGEYVIPYTKEHSKYGISLEQYKKKYVCVSDINRQDSQYKRGGTAICFLHDELWALIDQSFQRRQYCD